MEKRETEALDEEPQMTSIGPESFSGTITKIENDDPSHQSPSNPWQRYRVDSMGLKIYVSDNMVAPDELYLRVVRPNGGQIEDSDVTVMTVPFLFEGNHLAVYYYEGAIKTDDRVLNGDKYFELYGAYENGNFSDPFARSWEIDDEGNYSHIDGVRCEIVDSPT